MRDLKRFGTQDYPLHASGLRAMLVCPWRCAMDYLYPALDEGGPAGDTGSAMHKAAELFHTGKELAECIQGMHDSLPMFPRADLADAARMFLLYTQDERNYTADVLYVEEPIAFEIAAAPTDPTGEPITVIGKLDQIRRINTRMRILDIKTSKRNPDDVRQESTHQIAAYCVGAAIKYGEPVEPGPLIMPRQYRSSPNTDPVFWHFPWTFADCAAILEGVRYAVANIRAGRLWNIPNADCKWCSARSPDVCLPKLQKTIKVLQ